MPTLLQGANTLPVLRLTDRHEYSQSVLILEWIYLGEGLQSRQNLGHLGSIQFLSRHDPRNKIFLESEHNPLVRHLASTGQYDIPTGSGHGNSSAPVLSG